MKGPELINFAIKDVTPVLLKLIKKEKHLTIFFSSSKQDCFKFN